MTITTYDLELNDRIPQLVAEARATCEGTLRADNPDAVADIACGVFRLDRKAEECIVLIAMDAKCVPTGAFLLSRGTVSTAVATPREMLIRMLLCGAVQFVVVHNHPSGDTAPSREDAMLTKRLKEAGDIIGIHLADHIIIGAGRSYYSFRRDADK